MAKSDVAVPNDDDGNGITESDFDALAQGADSVVSGTVVENKDDLIGVPFVITAIKFYPSDMKAGSTYASLEITTKNGDKLILNDGSTGIRRQVVAYLVAKGIITVPDGAEDGPSSRYEAPLKDWNDGPNGSYDLSFDQQGREKAVINGTVRLLAEKGLRRSDYEATDSRPTGSTYYLA